MYSMYKYQTIPKPERVVKNVNSNLLWTYLKSKTQVWVGSKNEPTNPNILQSLEGTYSEEISSNLQSDDYMITLFDTYELFYKLSHNEPKEILQSNLVEISIHLLIESKTIKH
jgi:hypothetical protein